MQLRAVEWNAAAAIECRPGPLTRRRSYALEKEIFGCPCFRSEAYFAHPITPSSRGGTRRQGRWKCITD
jgi:hypothetical protein